MQTRILGRTGLQVSEVGLRCAADTIGRVLPPYRDCLNTAALQFVLSNPLVDVALVGMTTPELAETNNNISEEIRGRFDLVAIHDATVRE